MIKKYIETANLKIRGLVTQCALISGKHKMVIMYCLMEYQTVRLMN